MHERNGVVLHQRQNRKALGPAAVWAKIRRAFETGSFVNTACNWPTVQTRLYLSHTCRAKISGPAGSLRTRIQHTQLPWHLLPQLSHTEEMSSTHTVYLALRDVKIRARLLPSFFPSPSVWAITKAALPHAQATLFAARNNSASVSGLHSTLLA